MAATVFGAALSGMLLAGATPASADALDDGQWWRSAMGVEELHRSGATGKGVTVALIDGPIDSSVPELKGRVASSSTQCLAPGGGRQTATVKGVAADHATSMASLIVGSGKGTASGGRGISGIAPEATLRHYAALYASPRDPSKLTCGLTSADINEGSQSIAGAIRQAVKDGAKVLSVSLTADYEAEYIPALLEAYKAGAIVVASTNNETGRVYWPAAANGVVTVTHVDAAANLDTSAMRKSALVDFTAPGSAIATGRWTPSGWRSDAISDGSSQATAITAGGIAAVWSAHPEATGNQVLQALKDSIGLRAKNGKYYTWFRRVGENLPRATGKTESYGFGIAAPADAVKLDVASLPDTSPVVEEKGVGMPTAEEIAAAVASQPTSTASATPSSTDTAAAGAADAASEPADTGASSAPWLAVGGVVLALVAGLTFLLLRRRSSSGAEAAASLRPHQTSRAHDTYDTQAVADGAAAATKEHSHGQT